MVQQQEQQEPRPTFSIGGDVNEIPQLFLKFKSCLPNGLIMIQYELACKSVYPGDLMPLMDYLIKNAKKLEAAEKSKSAPVRDRSVG